MTRPDVLVLDPDDPRAVAPEVFRRVWRTTLDLTGFAVMRFGRSVTSHVLRRAMLDLVAAFPVRFVPERLGRFDQQVSSRFHRDGAPAASLLLLGYEASSVRSRVFVADSHRAAFEAGVNIHDFLAANNPMYPAGEAKLWPFATELPLPFGESCVVAINNSLMPFEPDGAAPLGLLHKAEVPDPDPTASRIIDSVGLMIADDPTGTPLPPAAVERFLTRDDVD